MPKYLTTQQYKLRSAFPVEADATLTDIALAFTISQAEAEIDAFMEFDLRLGGFEPHTAWMACQWDKKSRNIRRTRVPNFPVPIRRATRYQLQVANQPSTGKAFVAVINNNDVAYNAFDFYIEIVPLTAIYSLAPVFMGLGLDPSIVQLDYEAGFFLPTLGETLMNSGDNQTYYTSRGFWATSYTQALSMQPSILPPIPAVIYKNGGVQTMNTDYTADTREGSVTFVAENQGTDTITADYTATIPDAARAATIAQTTWLLGQRALANRGMTGMWRFSLGNESIIRPRMDETASFLCMEANLLLSPYLSVPVA